LSLQQLINNCKNNDTKAQSQLYKLFSGKLFSLCLKYSRNYAEAEDNLQDSFMTIFKKISQFNNKGSFEGWIKRITINTVLQRYRDKGVFNIVNEENIEDVTIEIEEDDISIDYLLRIIQELPDRYRMVFNLYVLDGYSHKDVANMLNISTGTSKSNQIPKEVSLTGEDYKADQSIADAVLKLDELAKVLRKKRMSSGAISFDKIEVKFNLDEANNPEGVYFKTSKDANKLIEEFMLLANRKVAKFIGEQKPPKVFLYRTHDEPDISKLADLQTFVSRFGYKMNFRDKQSTTASLNKLLKDVVGKKEQNLVDTLAIRTMSKAEYTTDNIGHYGLAFDYYTHFTSPIRRYPDVMVHRLLQHYLDKGKSVNQEVFEERCKHSSNMEYLATKAERDSIKYMQIKFMQDHKDQEFLGVISGVTDWGIYVEIEENMCEGMVRIRDLKDDYYKFDQGEYALIGEATKNMYQLGEEVIVKVKNTDLVRKHLDFSLIRKASE